MPVKKKKRQLACISIELQISVKLFEGPGGLLFLKYIAASTSTSSVATRFAEEEAETS